MAAVELRKSKIPNVPPRLMLDAPCFLVQPVALRLAGIVQYILVAVHTGRVASFLLVEPRADYSTSTSTVL